MFFLATRSYICISYELQERNTFENETTFKPPLALHSMLIIYIEEKWQLLLGARAM